MLTSLRYALATFCFAASVGCLALWWQFSSDTGFYCEVRWPQVKSFNFEATEGIAVIGVFGNPPAGDAGWTWFSACLDQVPGLHRYPVGVGQFGVFDSKYFFPLWYPALLFTLAGIASLKLGRRFTIRSAIIATTVVAGLLGMAVGM